MEVNAGDPIFAGGVKGGTVRVLVSISSGSSTVTAPSGTFTSSAADAGKGISIRSAGGLGKRLETTIDSVIDSSTAIVSHPAGSTVTNAFCTIGWDDLPALQSACDFVFNSGGGTVYISTGSYRLGSGCLNIWTNVSLKGDRAELIRDHFLVGNAATGAISGFHFNAVAYGRNNVSGINFIGNNEAAVIATYGNAGNPFPAIDADGNVAQTEYGELGFSCGPYITSPAGRTPIVGENSGDRSPRQINVFLCSFDEAPGSHAKNDEYGARSINIYHNFFGEYYDHSCYFAGWASLSGYPDSTARNVPIRDISIGENQFLSLNTIRGNGALKIRNNADSVSIHNNRIYLPNDTLLTLDIAAVGNGTGPLKRIKFSGQTGVCKDFLQTNNVDQLAYGYEIEISKNILEIAGFFWRSASDGSYFSGSCRFMGNKLTNLSATDFSLAQLNGLPTTGSPNFIEFSENYFDGLFSVQILGTLDLAFNENTASYRYSSITINPSLVNNAASDNHRIAGASRWEFRSNRLYGYAALFFDNSDASTINGAHSLSAANIYFSGNTLFGHPSRNWLTDLRGSTLSTYSGTNTVRLLNNMAAGGELSSVTTVPRAKLDTSLRAPILEVDGSLIQGEGAILFKQAGVPQFRIGFDPATENLRVVRYSSSGTGAGAPVVIRKSDGAVSINTGVGAASGAYLDIGGNAGGVLLPRMTKAQRNSFTASDGTIIYQTDGAPGLRIRENGVWVKCTTAPDA